MIQVYDALAPSYARHRGARDFVVEMLQRLHGSTPGGALLEIGCGTGNYAAALSESAACTVVGVDPSAEMLQRAPDLGRSAFLQARAARLPFADRTFDLVFSVNVVHHLDDASAYVGESFRVLAPGGVLCTATDSQAIIRRREPLSRYWPATVAVDLARYHGIDVLRGEMAVAGFDAIEECEGRSDFSISDIGPYRDKAYSCLQLIPEEAFSRGLRAMESDLRDGPLIGTSELAFLWGVRP